MGATRAYLTLKSVGGSTIYINTEAQANSFIEKWIATYLTCASKVCSIGISSEVQNHDDGVHAPTTKATEHGCVKELKERIGQLGTNVSDALEALRARLDQLEDFLSEAPFEHLHKINKAIAAFSSSSQCSIESRSGSPATTYGTNGSVDASETLDVVVPPMSFDIIDSGVEASTQTSIGQASVLLQTQAYKKPRNSRVNGRVARPKIR